jgi:hypothetical protein
MVPDWTRYRDVASNDIQRETRSRLARAFLKNDQHYVLVTPFTNTLLGSLLLALPFQRSLFSLSLFSLFYSWPYFVITFA